jgi:hypothetical protein
MHKFHKIRIVVGIPTGFWVLTQYDLLYLLPHMWYPWLAEAHMSYRSRS